MGGSRATPAGGGGRGHGGLRLAGRRDGAAGAGLGHRVHAGAGRGSVRVYPSDATSWLELAAGRCGVGSSRRGATSWRRFSAPGAQLIGVLAVGRRFDDRIVRSVDAPFLEALASAAARRTGRRRAPAGECGSLTSAGGVFRVRLRVGLRRH